MYLNADFERISFKRINIKKMNFKIDKYLTIIVQYDILIKNNQEVNYVINKRMRLCDSNSPGFVWRRFGECGGNRGERRHYNSDYL